MKIKTLVVYRTNYNKLLWNENGSSPQPSEREKSISFKWITEKDWLSKPDIISTPEQIIRQRFSDDSQCFVGVDEASGKTIYHLWLSPIGAYIEWIYAYIKAPKNGLLAFDAWVAPEYRGKSLHKLGACYAVKKSLEWEKPIISAAVEEHEFYSFFKMYAKMNLCVLEPQYNLNVLLLPFSRKIHWASPVSQAVKCFVESNKPNDNEN